MTDAPPPHDESSQPGGGTERAPADKLVLCPYCGATQTGGARCGACGGLFEPLSRKATQIAMGPWQVRDRGNPFRPGCSYEVLRGMIEAGKIRPNTVLRGPTTRQFWSVARNVEGIAHLLGYCHGCGRHVQPQDAACPECGEKFRAVLARNELGLRYRTPAEAERARQELEAQRQGTARKRRSPGETDAPPSHRPDTPRDEQDADRGPAASREDSPSGDLLDRVLGSAAGDNAQPIDFAPSADDADAAQTSTTAPAPPGSDAAAPAAAPAAPASQALNSPVIWVLAALNLLALVGVGLLVYLLMQSG